MQGDINLTNESCVSEVQSLERDALDISDTDVIASNAKGVSATTSLTMNTNFPPVHVSFSRHKVELGLSGLQSIQQEKECLLSHTESNSKLPVCLPLALTCTDVVSAINPLYWYAMCLVAPFYISMYEFYQKDSIKEPNKIMLTKY